MQQNFLTRFLFHSAALVLPMFVFGQRSIQYPMNALPGNYPVLFSPDLISSPLSEHSAPVFSPDGKVVLWTIMDKQYRVRMLEMRYKDGRWAAPSPPSFSDTSADDHYPSFSPDGNTLYFSSRRKLPTQYSSRGDIHLWTVPRTPTGWGVPQPCDTTIFKGNEYALSITTTGNAYYSVSSTAPTGWNLYTADLAAHGRTPAHRLPFNINSTGYEDGPFVAADGSYILFESQRAEGIEESVDLYIAFRTPDGKFSLPLNMGPSVNSSGTERFARVSPDGRYLFFGSSRNSTPDRWGFDIFWMKADIIDSLRQVSLANPSLDYQTGSRILDALDVNDLIAADTLLKQFNASYREVLEGVLLQSTTLRKLKRYGEALKVISAAPASIRSNSSIAVEEAVLKLATGDEHGRDMLKSLLSPGDQLRGRLLYVSSALLGMGIVQESEEYFEKAMALGAGSFPYYTRACELVQAGEIDRAFIALNRAADLGGITAKSEYEGNPCFSILHENVKWRQLLMKLK